MSSQKQRIDQITHTYEGSRVSLAGRLSRQAGTAVASLAAAGEVTLDDGLARRQRGDAHSVKS